MASAVVAGAHAAGVVVDGECEALAPAGRSPPETAATPRCRRRSARAYALSLSGDDAETRDRRTPKIIQSPSVARTSDVCIPRASRVSTETGSTPPGVTPQSNPRKNGNWLYPRMGIGAADGSGGTAVTIGMGDVIDGIVAVIGSLPGALTCGRLRSPCDR
jgi:hypothetical protein